MQTRKETDSFDFEKLHFEKTEYLNHHNDTISADRSEDSFSACMQVIGGFLISINTWGLVISYGVFQSFYTFELFADYTRSDLSWIGTLQASLLMITSIFSEEASRKGFFWSLLYFGSALTTFGMMTLSFCTTYYEVVLSQGICIGIGCGLICCPTMNLIDESFSKNRTLANGFATSGVGFGGLMYPLLFHFLLPSVGFAWTVRVMSSIALAIFAVAMVTLQFRKPVFSKTSATIESVDTSPPRRGPFMIFCVGEFFQFMGYFCPIFFTPVLAQQYLNVPERKSFWLLLIGNGAGIPGRIVVSYVALKFGVVGPFSCLAFLSGLVTMTWIVVSDFYGAVTFGSFNGFIFGASLALPALVVPVLCPSPSSLGRTSRATISNAFAALGTLLGCPIAGFLSENFMKPPQALQLFAGSSILFGAAIQAVVWILTSRSKKE